MMDENIVDLTNLREATDGDQELEQELFQEFAESSTELITELENADSNDAWAKTSHALKGISINLGAGQLGAYCKIAQESAEESEETKSELLNKIKVEHKKVLEFLANL